VIGVIGLLGLWRAPGGGGLLAPFVLLGLGCGMVYVTLQIAAFVGISDQDAGVGAGLSNTSQAAGGALGLAVTATIAYSGIAAKLAAAVTDPGRIQHAQAAANHHALLATACAGLTALLLAALAIPRSKASTSPQTESEGLSPTRA
jgi:hypothetical protein